MTGSELESLVRGFEEASVPAEAWTHAAHLVVGLAYLHRGRHGSALTASASGEARVGAGRPLRPAGFDHALPRMRAGLVRYLAALGKPSTAYHETVTHAWLLLLDDFLVREDHGQPVAELASAAVDCFARGRPLQACYSEARLGSNAARLRWLPPDLAPLPGQTLHVRPATPDDLAAINAIYNHYVPISTCTFDLEPMSHEARVRWFDEHDAGHPITVAVGLAPEAAEAAPAAVAATAARSGQVVGWGSLSRFRQRPAYQRTVESSVYVDAAHQGRGLGRLLVDDLLERARALGHHTVLAGVTSEQESSLALHQRVGFTEVGRLRQVGHKLGRWLDVVWLQQHLEEPAA